jgi:hypothetical protein
VMLGILTAAGVVLLAASGPAAVAHLLG